MTSGLHQRIEQYYQAWSRQDADAVMEFFTEASSFEDVAFAAKFEGREQIRSFVDLTYAGAPDFVVRPTQIIVGERQAGAQWTMSGTHQGDFPGLPATGKAFEVRAVSMIDFDENHIKTIVDYWSPHEFMRSVGLA